MAYRLYYNRANEAPHVWSFDEGDQTSEVCVMGFVLHGCNASSGQDLKVAAGSKDQPRVWLEVEAERMEMHSGVAHFYGAGWC